MKLAIKRKEYFTDYLWDTFLQETAPYEIRQIIIDLFEDNIVIVSGHIYGQIYEQMSERNIEDNI